MYQLELLEKWTRSAIHPETLLPGISEFNQKDYLDFALKEKERLCNYFRENSFIQNPSIPIQKIVHAHQTGIRTMTQVVVSYCSDYHVPPELDSFYWRYCHILEEVIGFIQVHLPEHFDLEQEITYGEAETSKKNFSRSLSAIPNLLLFPKIDKSLFRIATRPVREFIDEGKKITYRELFYYQELILSLKGLFDLEECADPTEELHIILLQLNFNYPRYVLHYMHWIDSKLSIIPTREDRLDGLFLYLRTINQVRFKPGAILIQGLPPVTEQLLTAIKTTYQYVLVEKRVSHPVISHIGAVDSHQKSKIRLSIPVGVLALLIKVFYKTGIIVNENKMEVFRIISESFATVKTEELSVDSLKNKYNMPISTGSYLHGRQFFLKALEALKDLEIK